MSAGSFCSGLVMCYHHAVSVDKHALSCTALHLGSIAVLDVEFAGN